MTGFELGLFIGLAAGIFIGHLSSGWVETGILSLTRKRDTK